MAIYTFRTPGLAIHSYLIIDDTTKKAIVIDPTRNVEPILSALQQHQVDLEYILETHVHADFASGAKELKSRTGNKAKIGCSVMGGNAWTPKYLDLKLHDGDEINLGSIQLKVMHTPGHTPEHLTFVLHSNGKPVIAFTGDFLFPGSIGRPDLLGDNQLNKMTQDLYNSVFTLLPQLPDDLVILPAHGAGSLCAKSIGGQDSSTLKQERSTNPSLQKQDQPAWSKKLLEGMPKAPASFSELKKINVAGAPLLSELPPSPKIKPQDMSTLNFSNFFLLDVRDQEEFAEQHIAGSVNIPWSQNFARWIGEFLHYDSPILIVSNNEDEAKKVVDALHLIGIDNIFGFVIGDAVLFKQLSNKLITMPMPNGKDIAMNLDNVEVIDVRTDSEWKSGHIPGAKHYEVNGIANEIKHLSKDKPLAFICGSGYRSSIAASLALKAGLKNVSNVKGGMQAWHQAQLPTERN